MLVFILGWRVRIGSDGSLTGSIDYIMQGTGVLWDLRYCAVLVGTTTLYRRDEVTLRAGGGEPVASSTE